MDPFQDHRCEKSLANVDQQSAVASVFQGYFQIFFIMPGLF